VSTSIQKPKEFGLRLDARRRTFLVRLGLLIITSLLFTLAGPFGTFQAGGFFDRLLYWFGVNGVSILIAVNVKKFGFKKICTLGCFSNRKRRNFCDNFFVYADPLALDHNNVSGINRFATYNDLDGQYRLRYLCFN
jgi:hypothetical protein